MNGKLPFVLVLFLLAPHLSADVLRLLNGDRILGRLIDLHGPDLRFHPRWSETTNSIPGRYVGYVTMADREFAGAFEAGAVLRLTNGDWLEGALLHISSNRVEMLAPWGDLLSARRTMVDSVYPAHGSNLVVWAGPGARSAWSVVANQGGRPGSVSFVGGVLHSENRVMVSRQVPAFPKRFRLRFLVEAGVENPFFMFAPFSESSEGVAGSFTIQVSNRAILCTSPGPNGTPAINQWNREFPPPADRRYHFSLYGDHQTGEYQLFANGQTLGRWKEAGPREVWLHARRDGAFFIWNPSNNSRLSLSGLRVETWDGSPPPQQAEVSDLPPAPRLWLRNGDQLAGPLGLVSGLVAHVQIKGNDVPVSLDRVFRLELGEGTPERARRESRDVEITLRDGRGRFVLALQKIADGLVHGSSEQWADTLVVPLHLIESLRFNLYTRRRLDNEQFQVEWIFPADESPPGGFNPFR